VPPSCLPSHYPGLFRLPLTLPYPRRPGVMGQDHEALHEDRLLVGAQAPPRPAPRPAACACFTHIRSILKCDLKSLGSEAGAMRAVTDGRGLCAQCQEVRTDHVLGCGGPAHPPAVAVLGGGSLSRSLAARIVWTPIWTPVHSSGHQTSAGFVASCTRWCARRDLYRRMSKRCAIERSHERGRCVTLENLEKTRRVAPALGEAGRPRGTVRAKKHVFDDHDQKGGPQNSSDKVGTCRASCKRAAPCATRTHTRAASCSRREADAFTHGSPARAQRTRGGPGTRLEKEAAVVLLGPDLVRALLVRCAHLPRGIRRRGPQVWRAGSG